MIRSANRKLITPPKLMPAFHSTPAKGTLPMEQTKLIMLTIGPIKGPQTFDNKGWSTAKKRCQKLSGTQAAMAPAIKRPSTMSRMTAAHSMMKMWDTEVTASFDRRRCQRLPSSLMAMSMAAWPSIEPASPLSL